MLGNPEVKRLRLLPEHKILYRLGSQLLSVWNRQLRPKPSWADGLVRGLRDVLVLLAFLNYRLMQDEKRRRKHQQQIENTARRRHEERTRRRSRTRPSARS